MGRCRFHPELQPLCPILRLGDVVRLAGQDFPALAATVSGDRGHGGGGGTRDVGWNVGTQGRGEWGCGTWVHRDVGDGDMRTQGHGHMGQGT